MSSGDITLDAHQRLNTTNNVPRFKHFQEESKELSFPQNIMIEEVLVHQRLNTTNNVRRFKYFQASFTQASFTVQYWQRNVGSYYWESVHPYENSVPVSSASFQLNYIMLLL